MNLKSEKGYTGVDIAVAVVVLFIFVSIIAFLSYSINSSTTEIELKSEATAIAVEEIERLKNTLKFEDTTEKNILEETKEIEGKEGFYKTVLVEDYANDKEGKIAGLVKKVTVQIQYMFKGKKQTVELSTIISKEN